MEHPTSADVIRVLMVSADPTNRLALQKEERAIRRQIRGKGKVELEVLPAATIDDLASALLDSDHRPFHVLHFSGHCEVSNSLLEVVANEVGKQHGVDVQRKLLQDPAALRALKVFAAEQASVALPPEWWCDDFEKENRRLEIKRSRSLERCEDVAKAGGSRALSAEPPKIRGVESETALIPSCFASRNFQVFSSVPSQPKGSVLLRLPLSAEGSMLSVALSRECIMRSGRLGSLAFETDGNGDPSQSQERNLELIRPADFASLLERYTPPLRCVVLNSCNSLVSAAALRMRTRLLNVVCTQGKLSDTGALRFSEGFYAALAADSRAAHGASCTDPLDDFGFNSIERAFDEGKLRMRLHGVGGIENGTSGRVCLLSATGDVEGLRRGGYAVGARIRGRPSAHERRLRHLEKANREMKRTISQGLTMLAKKDQEIARLKGQLIREGSNGRRTPNPARRPRHPSGNTAKSTSESNPAPASSSSGALSGGRFSAARSLRRRSRTSTSRKFTGALSTTRSSLASTASKADVTSGDDPAPPAPSASTSECVESSSATLPKSPARPPRTSGDSAASSPGAAFGSRVPRFAAPLDPARFDLNEGGGKGGVT